MDILVAANDVAQRLFHEMVEQGAYHDETHPLTRRYVEAEREVDRVLARLQARTLAAGDHHVGVGR